jgi:hypothetical protein
MYVFVTSSNIEKNLTKLWLIENNVMVLKASFLKALKEVYY